MNKNLTLVQRTYVGVSGHRMVAWSGGISN